MNKAFNQLKYVGKNKRIHGFTLLEMLVAMAILAWIMITAQVVIQVSSKAGEVSRDKAEELKQLDRLWILMETDMRNIVAYDYQPEFGEFIPSMLIAESEDYVMNFIRAGQANPLLLPRSEVVRIGYRIEDNALWRDSWIDPFNPDIDLARQQKVFENIEDIEVEVLPHAPRARSFETGPWLRRWPPEQDEGQVILPLAIRVTLVFENDFTLYRVFALASGVVGGSDVDGNNAEVDGTEREEDQL